MLKARSRHASFAVVLILLGLLLTLQFRTQRLMTSSLEALSTEELVTMWKKLDVKRTQLQTEVNSLLEQLQALENKSSSGLDAQKALQKELDRLQLAYGLIPVKGPGITVTITGDAPLLYYDLVDLVNELWASGAEAIAINDQRVTAATIINDITEGNNIYITVNGNKLLYPIVIKAIGDPHTLEKGLTFTGGLVDNLNTLYNIFPDIKKAESLSLPAAPPPTWRYARPAPPANKESEKG
ncbi:MAG: hypothetical protein PWP65_1150 [Clostridia bacterium]|nr:hypothetical protein [Clostridia bacterium]